MRLIDVELGMYFEVYFVGIHSLWRLCYTLQKSPMAALADIYVFNYFWRSNLESLYLPRRKGLSSVSFPLYSVLPSGMLLQSCHCFSCYLLCGPCDLSSTIGNFVDSAAGIWRVVHPGVLFFVVTLTCPLLERRRVHDWPRLTSPQPQDLLLTDSIS